MRGCRSWQLSWRQLLALEMELSKPELGWALLQESTKVSGGHGVEHLAVLHPTLMEFYSNHVIAGRPLFPAAGYLEMGIAAALKGKSQHANVGAELRDVSFLSPMDLEEGATLRTPLTISYRYGQGTSRRASR